MMKTHSDPKVRQILIEAIYRQKRPFLVTYYTILILTVLVILFLPRRYESQAKLMVENVRSASPLSTQQVNTVVTKDDVSDIQINSEVDLLQSQGVIRKALGMPAVPTGTNAQAMTSEQKLVTAMQHRLTVNPVHASSIIDVQFVAATPAEATRRLNAILDAYFEERGGVTRSTGAAEFFERQVQDFGTKLEQARDDLIAFDMQHDLTNMDDQKKLAVNRIAALEDHLSQIEAQLAEANGRSRNLKHQLQTTPSRSKTLESSVTNQYSQEHLNTALVDLENQRTEMLSRYQPTDRAILALNKKIATIQQAIHDSGSHPANEFTTDVNPVWQQLSTSLSSTTAEIYGIEAQHAELLQQKQAAEQRLHELQDATSTYDNLSQHFQEVQANYTLYVQKRDQARIGEALDKEKMFDVSLVQRPISSLVPVRPKPMLYLVAGMMMALFLSCALALYKDTSSERVYTPAQLDRMTGMRTIATIPKAMDANGRQKPDETAHYV
ncbi:MAG: GumC family protein [Acidobacteriaceae bacterium]